MDIVQDFLQADINRPVRYLYENYYDDAVTAIRLKGGSDEDAADIFQEAVLILIDKIKSGKFREESSIKTFLIGISRNLWLFEKRTRERRNTREIHFTLHEVSDTTFSDEDFHDRIYAKANTNTMQKIFEQVGELCSRILVGFYYDKLSMKELLTKFDYENEQVLRNRKAKCMKKLKKLLTDNPDILHQLKILSVYE